MDKTRLALYFALATITYLLLLAWNEDYPPVVTTAVSNVDETAVTPVGDLPNLTPTLPPSNSSDIPTQTPQNGSSSASIIVAPIEAAISETLISVNTDALDIRIDPQGGDIVYLALPLYLKQIDVTDDPFVILDTTPGSLYVAQSGLVGMDGSDRINYRSNATNYELAESADVLEVDLQAVDDNGVRVTKRFTFHRDSYLIDIEFIVENNSNEAWQDNVFAQIKRDGFEDPSGGGSFSRTYLGFVTTAEDDPYKKVPLDDIDDGSESFEFNGGWIGFSQHYFVSAFIPGEDGVNRFSTRKNSIGQYIGGYTGTTLQVPTGSTAATQFQFYAGPKDQYVLRDIAENLDLTIDYGWLWFLSSPIYWLLTVINGTISNFGLAIVALTVVVKAFFYKLSETQYKSMAGMRRVMPKMQQLKERYGDDRMKLQKATMDLYKKEKISPFGGCLPMLVQMPVFIALYFVLLESVELRHAPFFLWINDLSVRDPFFILPLIMGGTMYLQTKLSPTPADPMQAKMMTFMPIMMTLFFLWFPAGLVLYWVTNSALGILQQWYITRKIEREYEAGKAASS